MEMTLRPIRSFMDGACEDDLLRFPPVLQSEENLKLDCPLSSVTQMSDNNDESLQEVNAASPDIFYVDADIIAAHPLAMPTLSLATKTATLMLNSIKYMRAFEDNIKACHDTETSGVKPMTVSDVARIRALFAGGIKVGAVAMEPPGDFGEFDREMATVEPRRVVINSLILQRVTEIVNEGAEKSRKLKLRRIAALLAVVLFHEAGGHLMHTMVKHDYFFHANGTAKNKVSPTRNYAGRIWDDFGTMLELVYFRGVPMVDENLDDKNNARHFDAKRFGIAMHDLQAMVFFEIRSTDFLPATYGDSGAGMLGLQVEMARLTAGNHATELAARQASAKRNRSAPVALPQPEDYDGDEAMKANLIYLPSARADLMAAFDLAHTVTDSTGEEVQLHAGSIRPVGGGASKGGKRR